MARTGPKMIDWSAHALGREPDHVVAAAASVTTTAVRRARELRGIPPAPGSRVKGRTALERVRERSKPTQSGCIEFTGALDSRGYGRVWDLEGRYMAAAHRVTFMAVHGPIAPTQLVCHRCDNPACVNVDHLFIGSHADNSADMVAKGRSTWKVTDEQVKEIREAAANGERQRDIARRLGIAQATVGRVVRREQRYRET